MTGLYMMAAYLCSSGSVKMWVFRVNLHENAKIEIFMSWNELEK